MTNIWIGFISVIVSFLLNLNGTSLNSQKYLEPFNDISKCKTNLNCSFQTWKVEDSKKAFYELIDIIESTPRLTIIQKNDYYIHALATSRIMKFVDDIEVKFFNKENIVKVKSSSRQGIYDLGVNKRRVETFYFRLVDIYR